MSTVSLLRPSNDVASTPSVLIAEDSGIVALEFIQVLQDAGLPDVTWVQTGQSIKDLCSERQFDVSLIDIHLADGETGVASAQQCYAALGHIIFMSGDTRLAVRPFEIAHMFIQKPVVPSVIADMIISMSRHGAVA